MAQHSLPEGLVSLPETIKRFRENAHMGNYELAVDQHEKSRLAIDDFIAQIEGDHSRRTKWSSLARELDAEAKIVKVQDQLLD